jgi:DNA repair exonuclease SbcCD ATPase subunit
MRFVRLVVNDFRAIQRLELEFGPGINVLQGPNDLGKSTVAEAIRAALLVQPSGTQADSYGSWFSGVSPRVELTLVDSEGRWWKVKKTFSAASASSAEMFHSKDGLTFALDCKAREVEERLRALLAWGIPAPGGRGAPRGMPDSFIAQALLGGQDDADDILGQSLAADAAESGKLRLTKALASLAQDPLFKDVLLRAQGEVDQFFTATGQRKRGQGSCFTHAGERVRTIGDELGQRKAQLQTSSAIESEVAALRQRHADAQAVLDEANTVLQATKARRARGIEREALVQREVETKKEIEEIDAQMTRLAAMERDIEQAKIAVDARNADLAAATAAVETKETQRRAAEEAVRVATGDEAVRQRELKKAQLEKRAAELASELATITANGTTLKLAIEARNAVVVAARAEATAASEVNRAIADREGALEKERNGALELETSRALTAFVHWLGAVAAREECAKAQDSARRVEADALTKDEEASRIERELAKAEEKFAAREAALPTSAQVQKLRELERELEKAEAALGGGINVVVRPRRPIDVTARADGSPATSERLADVRTFAANRALGLAIDDVAELEVTAGSADARSLVESLRHRWATEATPALAKAGTSDLAALVAATDALKQERLAAVGTLRSAQQARAEAKGLREQAALHRQRAGVTPMSDEEAEARKAAIGNHDIAQLQTDYAALKEPPEARLEQLHQELAKVQGALQGQRTRSEEQARLAEFALAQARERSKEAEEIHKLRVASLPATDLDAQDAELAAQLRTISEEQAKVATQLRNLAVEANLELERARHVLENATAAHGEAKAGENKARIALDDARERHSGLAGAIGQFRPAVDLLDRAAAESAWQAARSTLESISLESLATADDLLRAETSVATAVQQYAAAREELITREGALAHIGGAALREEVERLEEARSVAEAQQRALEIDADAWKLLCDTLRAVENEEGAHLGRALAGPVGTRFAELTGGRYRELRLDAALKADGLGIAGATAEARTVLEALSVGTRSQLAALIRLTIADQLQSAIVLDDHLVHTDVSRLAWFHEFLRKVAVNAQVVVITCRPQDYLSGLDVSAERPVIDLAGGTMRAVDLGRVLQRHPAPQAQ